MLPLITTAGTRPWRYKMTKEEPLKHFILIFALIGMPAFFKIQFEIHIIYSWNCFSGVERAFSIWIASWGRIRSWTCSVLTTKILCFCKEFSIFSSGFGCSYVRFIWQHSLRLLSPLPLLSENSFVLFFFCHAVNWKSKQLACFVW